MPEQILLAKWRESHGMTQHDLAAEIGTTTEMIEKWEKGKQNPKGDRATRLRNFINEKDKDLATKIMMDLF